jgi:hypothetical protein
MGGGPAPFGPQIGGYAGTPWPTQQAAGIGPIGPLVPQQSGFPFIPQGAGPFGQQAPISPFVPSLQSFAGVPAQVSPNPIEQVLGIGAGGQYGGHFAQQPGIPGVGAFGVGGAAQGPQQSWQQQRDPRAELLANTIAQITQTRDPRIEYLAQIVTHPLVATNPVLKDLVAKELLTTALQQVAFKTTVRPEVQGQSFLRGGEQIGYGQGVDPHTAAAIKSQVLAELANFQASQMIRGGQSLL